MELNVVELSVVELIDVDLGAFFRFFLGLFRWREFSGRAKCQGDRGRARPVPR